MVIVRAGQPSEVLVEGPAQDEAQLQERLKHNPDLLPIEEFGLTGPLMVVGRETTLPSGSVDLMGVSREGDLIVVEFKTGPQNPDFRHALAQALDYGAQLWAKSYGEFEHTIAVPFFNSPRAAGLDVHKQAAMRDAAALLWKLSDEEYTQFEERLGTVLSTGAIRYAIAAQRFTPTMETTAQYLSHIAPQISVYLVEIVRFGDEDLGAFEARTVYRPQPRSSSTPSTALNESTLLARLEDDGYRAAIATLIDAATRLGLKIFWGVGGVSLRLPNADTPEPISVGWIFPPGISGWYGLTNVTLGYELAAAAKRPSLAYPLDAYVKEIAAIPDALPVKPSGIEGSTFNSTTAPPHIQELVSALERLVKRAAGEDPNADS
jgi:hypothetical protein